MNLIHGEEVVLQSETGELLLTTHRVYFASKQAGSQRIASIMLEDLTYIENVYRSQPWLLTAAAVMGLTGIAAYLAKGVVAFLVAGFSAGAIFFAAYFGSREQVMSFASSGG